MIYCIIFENKIFFFNIKHFLFEKKLFCKIAIVMSYLFPLKWNFKETNP